MHAPPELDAFVRREHPRLVRAVHLLLDDHGVAEEVAQEALLRAASRWEQVAGMDSPGGWTHRVAINLATSQLRRRRLERRARARSPDDDVLAPDTATAVTVRAALQELPAAQRRVLVLRHVLDWSTADIAAADGITSEAVRQRLHRARGALRERLGPDLVGSGLSIDDTDETDDTPRGAVTRPISVEETTDAR